MSSASAGGEQTSWAQAFGQGRSLVVLCLGSLVLCSALAILNVSPFGDLSGHHTDHLHHTFASDLFWRHGLRLYTEPFENLWSDTGFPFPSHAWGQMPMVYPPGVFLLFTPLVLLARMAPLSTHGFALAAILWVLLLSHVALGAMFLSLRRLPPGGRVWVGAAVWMLVAHMALEGFYDAAYLGLGAMGILGLHEGEDAASVRWFSLAAFVHFRAAVFAPLAFIALYRLVVKTPDVRSLARALWLPALLVVGSLVTFCLMYPLTASYRASADPALWHDAGRLAEALAGTAVVMLVTLWCSAWEAALVLAACTLLAVTEVQHYWWHGAVVLAVPLSVGACFVPRRLLLARGSLLAWAWWMELFCWRSRIHQVFPEVWRHFRMH